MDGKKQKIECAFNKNNDGTFGFKVGSYNKSKPLIIDPIIYSTFIGGSGDDDGADIKVDNAGYAYVAGGTRSTTFSSYTGPLTFHGGEDGFVAKLNPNGSSLVYCTFIGGDYFDRFNSIDIDNTGSVFLCGVSESSNYPTLNPFNSTLLGSLSINGDMVVSVLAPNGLTLTYSTYLGTYLYDGANSICIDPVNPNLCIIVGYVTDAAPNFPVPNGPTITPNATTMGLSEVVVAKIDITAGAAGLIFSRYLNGTANDFARGIVTDIFGNNYVTGTTQSQTFTGVPNTTTFPGGTNFFITELNSTGTILFSRVLGSSSNDETRGIDLQKSPANPSAPDIYVVGYTSGSDLPNSINNNAGMDDAFVMRLDNSGNNEISRYIGGSQNDDGYDIKVTTDGVFTTGVTRSTNFPAIPCLSNYNFQDAFATKFSLDLNNLMFSRTVGGSLGEVGQGIDVFDNQEIFITGFTISPNFPVTPLAFDPTYNGAPSLWDCFVTRIHIDNPSPVTATANPSNVPCNTGSASLIALPAGTGYTYNWTPTSNLSSSTAQSPTLSPPPVNSTVYTVTVTDAGGCTLTSTTLVSITGFCCSPAAEALALTLPPDHKKSNTNNAGMPLNPTGTYFIDGVFTISQNINFSNATLYLTPYTKIVVDANVSLSFNSCTLQAAPGCDMWDGIYATGVNSEVYFTDCSDGIRDMINGVVISGTSKLIAFNSSFDDNRISIQLNSLPANYSGTIEKCTFRKITGLIVPYTSLDKPLNGIRIYNCRDVTIGNQTNAGNGNIFLDVWNGVWIYSYSSNGANNVSRTINLYNNRFIDISGGPNLWTGGNSFYTSSTGCAIWSKHAGFNYWNAGKSVKITGTSPTVNFDHCNKNAIINGYGMDVRNTISNDCNVGFVNAQNGQICYAYSNTIQNTMLGIHKIGNERVFTAPNQYGFIAGGNNITLAQYPISNPGISTGIRSTYYSGSSTGNSHFEGNDIYIPMEKDAYGLSIENGSNDKINDNHVFFSATAPVNLVWVPPYSRGLNVDNSAAQNIYKNTFMSTVNGFATTELAAGIYLSGVNSKLSSITCNAVTNLQYGIYSAGDQTTGYDKIAGNTLSTQRCGLCFDKLGSLEGTLGDIGLNSASVKHDCNNNFSGINDLRKVFRFTNTALTNGFTLNKIYTQIGNLDENIPDSWSSATNGTLRYKIMNLGSFNSIFDILLSCQGIGNVTSSNPIYDIAVRIANNTSSNTDYSEEARWLDRRMLMEWLVEDPELLTDYPVINSFYLGQNNILLQDLAEVERSINLLSSDEILGDSTQWETNWQNATTLNNAITTDEYFGQNEIWINSKYLWLLKNDIDGLTNLDKQTIQSLAESCPYVAGRAVYKARAIYNMLEPNVYFDDRQICNALGLYKGGPDQYTEALNILSGNSPSDLLANIRVYPNPATTTIYIEHDMVLGSEAEFSLYNLFGNRVLTQKISGGSTKLEVSVNNLNSGMYTYKVSSRGSISKTGKIIIQ